MAERVKLTFQKSERGEFVTIRKDGGFTVEDMTRLTKAAEELFHDGGAPANIEEGIELEAGESDENLGLAGNGEDEEREPFLDKVQEAAKKAAAQQGRQGGDGGKGPLGDTTPPAGRGQVAAKLPDGTGITKEGDVDRRTLRGSPENPDREQQRMVKKVEQKVAGKSGGGEARQ